MAIQPGPAWENPDAKRIFMAAGVHMQCASLIEDGRMSVLEFEVNRDRPDILRQIYRERKNG